MTSVFDDPCRCGHVRAEHVNSYRECAKCSQSADGHFRCEPGVCDHFTWAPPERPKEPA